MAVRIAMQAQSLSTVYPSANRPAQQQGQDRESQAVHVLQLLKVLHDHSRKGLCDLYLYCLAHVVLHAFLQSAKLRQAQEQNNNLTKEKEKLMQAVQDLQARVKQGAQPHPYMFLWLAGCRSAVLGSRMFPAAGMAPPACGQGLQSVRPCFGCMD